MASKNISKYSRDRRLMKKYLLLTLLFTGIAFSQVTEEEQVKIVLADYVIQLDKVIKLNMNFTESMDTFVAELQAIENPSDELIVILKKYNLYIEPKEGGK